MPCVVVAYDLWFDVDVVATETEFIFVSQITRQGLLLIQVIV